MTASFRRPLWAVIVVAAVGLLAVATFDEADTQTNAERVQALADAYACPECAGQSVAESNAAVAVEIRAFLRDEVEKGTSDRQIRDELIQAYGGEVLLTPPASGVGALIWILPVLVVVGGCGALGFVLTRQRGGSRDVTPDDEALVAAAREQRR